MLEGCENITKTHQWKMDCDDSQRYFGLKPRSPDSYFYTHGLLYCANRGGKRAVTVLHKELCKRMIVTL